MNYKKIRLKTISINEYNKKCEKIIKKNKGIDETLIDLLDFAAGVIIEEKSEK